MCSGHWEDIVFCSGYSYLYYLREISQKAKYLFTVNIISLYLCYSGDSKKNYSVQNDLNVIQCSVDGVSISTTQSAIICQNDFSLWNYSIPKSFIFARNFNGLILPT